VHTLPSLHEYVLIEQFSVRLEHYYKLPDGCWVLTKFDRMTSAVTLPSLQLDLPVERIDERVDWTAEPANLYICSNLL
jgi:hypothetical protein